MNDIESLSKKIDELREQITLLRIDVGGLKIKTGFVSTVFGLIGGAISIGSVFLMQILKGKLF